MSKPVLKFKKLDPDAVLPKYMTPGAVGFDLFSISEFQLECGGRTMARTGLAVEVPEGYELQIRARSGLSVNFPNYFSIGVGTIDQDYRGELTVPIYNHDPFYHMVIKKGDRIAQAILNAIEKPEILEVEELSETERGEGGFGSTG